MLESYTCIIMDKTKWKSIMLPKDLIDSLELFAQSDTSRNLGFTNKSQLAASAVREFLRNYSTHMANLDYLEMKDDLVKIMDYRLGSVVEVKIDKENYEVFCRKDNSNNCNHADFLFTIPRFKEDLKKFTPKPHTPKIKVYTKENIDEALTRIINHSIYNPKKGKITKRKLRDILNKIIIDLE